MTPGRTPRSAKVETDVIGFIAKCIWRSRFSMTFPGMISPAFLSRAARRLVPESFRPAVRLAYGRLRAVRYRGSAVECPCCDWQGSRFLPSRDPRHPHESCPRCNSAARHRLLLLYLADKLCPGDRVLHIGPEPILDKRFRRMNIDYVTADLAMPAVDVRLDMTNMPFAESSFDIIVAVHVLEHVPDDAAAIAEAYRVLKPGGLAVLQSAQHPNRETTDEYLGPLPESDRMARFEGPDHMRLYGQDFADRLRAGGFEVAVKKVPNWFDRQTIGRFGLDPLETFYELQRPRH